VTLISAQCALGTYKNQLKFYCYSATATTVAISIAIATAMAVFTKTAAVTAITAAP